VQRLRRVLGGRDKEEGVGQGAASGRSAGGDDHPGGVRVDADDQGVRVFARGREDRAAVARTYVDRDPRMASRQGSDEAVVELAPGACSNLAEHVFGNGRDSNRIPAVGLQVRRGRSDAGAGPIAYPRLAGPTHPGRRGTMKSGEIGAVPQL
jgi:hypothetical protein